MNIIQTLLLSVVEGISEFLPISSTGHLILVSNLLQIQQSEFVKSFEIIIQLGAILAVCVIYMNKLIYNFTIWKNITIAFIPTAISGVIFYKFIKLYLIGNSTVVVWSLLIGGLVMLFFEKYYKPKKFTSNDKLNTKNLIIIGLLQSISMIPGVSRAFATIFGGMLVGLNRRDAVEFSFFLAIPTMLGASVLDLVKTDLSLWNNSNLVILAIGFLGSFVTAYFVVKWLIKYVESHNFVSFGWYRIILAMIFLLFFV